MNNLSSPVVKGCASCGAPRTALDQQRVDERVAEQSATVTAIIRAFCPPALLCVACLTLAQNMIFATGNAMFRAIGQHDRDHAAEHDFRYWGR